MEHASAGEQVPHDCFTARNELIGEHEPRPCFDAARLEERDERFAAFRPDGEIVLENDRLAVEQKAFARRRRIIEQLVDERDEPLPEPLERVIPFPIPVGVGDDVDVQSRIGKRETGSGKRETAAKKTNRGCPRQRQPRLCFTGSRFPVPGSRPYTARLPVTNRTTITIKAITSSR